MSVPGHKHQGWGLTCRPMGSDGELYPTGLADNYIPISVALSSLGTQEVTLPVLSLCLLHCVCPRGVTVEANISALGGSCRGAFWDLGYRREIPPRAG